MDKTRKDDEVMSKDESNVCRLCLGSTNVKVHIGENINNSTSIVEKIHYCTSLVVKVGDDFPQYICTTCTENLDFIYNFKSKAISCDLELSKNVHRDVDFTYIQVSDDPLNMTYKLDLNEQDSSTNLGDSCVYNIVDGDELIIEPVNAIPDANKNVTTFTVTSNDDSEMSEIISHELNGDSNSCHNSITTSIKTNATAGVKRSSDESLMNFEKTKSKKIKSDNDIDNEKPMLIVKNGKVVYICGVCSFESDSMVSLLSHRTCFHIDMGNFKCPDCPTYYKTAGLLKRHITLNHNVTFHICKYCNKKFTNKQGVDRHINFHHKDTSLEFQCVICSAYFDTLDKMEDHLVVHYTNPSTFNCNHCDRSFTTYAAKNKHVDLEHMVEIECSICHVVLPTKEAMDKHNNSVHQPKKKGNKMYACNTCGKYFSSIKDILSHRETHLSKKL